MRYSTKQFLIVITFFCIVMAAFARGRFLLGTTAGIFFGMAGTGTLFVNWRVFSVDRKFQMTRQVIAVLFAFAVFTILAIPTQFSPTLAHFIDGHHTERLTQSELQSVLSSDPSFSRLRYECNYRKCIIVSVNGNVARESDLLDLRDKIFSNCPHVSSRWLYWKVTVEESGVSHSGTDLGIFGDPADPSG